MFVKICGITNEDDALLAVALGADAVGFVFAPSVRQIAVQKVYDITRRLPPEVLTVGDFATKMILVDAPEPGSGEVFDWKMAAELPEGLHLILAGGLTPENVANGISIVRPWGVDVSSGVESQPGRKDPILMKRFIENAKAAEPAEYDGGTFIPYDWRDE